MFCSLALVLLVDSSASISPQNAMLQRQAYVEALRSPQLISLIEDHAPMALIYVEWADRQQVVLSWRIFEDAEDVAKFALELQAAPHAKDIGSQTALGLALRFGVEAFASAPCEAQRKVIDISGDGANNSGEVPSVARDEAEELNITINGLPIEAAEPGVTGYYEQNVITRRGFVIPARSFEDVTASLKKKLQREIALGD